MIFHFFINAAGSNDTLSTDGSNDYHIQQIGKEVMLLHLVHCPIQLFLTLAVALELLTSLRVGILSAGAKYDCQPERKG